MMMRIIKVNSYRKEFENNIEVLYDFLQVKVYKSLIFYNSFID